MDLTNSMLALNRLYVRFLSNQSIEFDTNKPTLYIRDLKKGSIFLELGTYVGQTVSAIDQINSICEFTNYFKKISKYLLGENISDKPIMVEQELKDAASVYDVVANDNGSIINFNVSGTGNNFYFSGVEANAIQNGAAKEIKNLKSKDKAHVSKQLMFFYQTRFDTDSNKGNKAIIESVTEKPLSVTFNISDI